MSRFKLTIPILYLVFNRLDTVKQTFLVIQKAKPKKLFLAADGPRNSEEKKKTDIVREYILNNISWDCEVKTLFRKKNLGCEHACKSAITWFFKNVEMGIILEDDCLVDPSFFRFCQELLEKYRHNNNVFSINALSEGATGKEYSYDFSKIIRLWGWASWRRAWNSIYQKEEEYITNQINPLKYLKEVFPNFFERVLFEKRFLGYVNHRANTWEFPWFLGIVRSKGLNVVPNVNLVENIGIDEENTNTSPNFIDKMFLVLKRNKLKFPLKHPKDVKLNPSIHRRFIFRDFIRVIFKKILFI